MTSKLGVRNKELFLNRDPEVTYYILPPPKPPKLMTGISFLTYHPRFSSCSLPILSLLGNIYIFQSALAVYIKLCNILDTKKKPPLYKNVISK